MSFFFSDALCTEMNNLRKFVFRNKKIQNKCTAKVKAIAKNLNHDGFCWSALLH